jgi:hypothetical protein
MIRRISSSAPVRNCWPAAVRVTPLAARSNSGAPTQSSSARMRRLKAGWVTLPVLGRPREVAGLGQGDEIFEPDQFHR